MKDSPDKGAGGAELFMGYAPAFHGADKLRLTSQQLSSTNAGLQIRWSTLEYKDDRDRRLRADVIETPSETQARAWIDGTITKSNVRLVRGHAELGTDAVVYPREAPRTVYYPRANIVVCLSSCGRHPIDVTAWALLAARDLREEEGGDPLVQFERQADLDDAPGAVVLRVWSKWDMGPSAFYKFTAKGGTLTRTRDGKNLLLWPDGPRSPASILALAIEPGRPTYQGQFSTT